MKGYTLYASPTLFPGQVVQAAVQADSDNAKPIRVQLYLTHYGADDQPVRENGPQVTLEPGARQLLKWQIGEFGGDPIAEIGLELASKVRAEGTVYLDFLRWDGTPRVTFQRPEHNGTMWRRAWVDSVDQFEPWWPEAFRLIQNQGVGLLSQGTREWKDYAVSADITPHMAKAFGIAARVQGLRRYYALVLGDDNKARLIKAMDGTAVLSEMDFPWTLGRAYAMNLVVNDTRLRASVDGRTLFEVEDTGRGLSGGGIGLLCEEGRVATDAVRVGPAE